MKNSKSNPAETDGLPSILLLGPLPSGTLAGEPQSLPKFDLPVSPMADMTYIGKTVHG